MIAKNATFDSCKLNRLHFGYTDLSGSSLKGAMANGAQFQNVKLKRANLEGASLAGGSINADTDLEDVSFDERRNFDGLKVLRATSRNSLFQDYDCNNGTLQRRTAAMANLTVDKPLEILINTEQRQVTVAKMQIQRLIQNAAVTRLTAQQFAGQIEEALRGIPANQGNRLTEPLQTMLEFAEVLRNLAPEAAPPATQLNREDLEARIIELERLVERLTEQLSDAAKAQKVAEELVQSDGFIANFRRSAGQTAGFATVTAVASVVTVGVPAAAVYFLGPEHPLVASFINRIGQMPK